MTIGPEDLERLLTELNSRMVGQMHYTWFEDNGFDEDVQERLLAWARAGLLVLLAAGRDEGLELPEALTLAAGTFVSAAFTIGWEAHKEYGRKEE